MGFGVRLKINLGLITQFAAALDKLKIIDQFPNLSSGDSTHYLIA